ncbi:helix-turn-helix transcriptional regulator [Escherichia coli]|nr:helix-turn-helix transcriptional regulator [Escherichia coli]
MDITEIRRGNLKALLAAFLATGGRKKDFADLIGIESPQLTHITAEPPSRNIGDRIARRIEVNLKLDRGWLDVIQESQNFDISHSDRGGYKLQNKVLINPINNSPDARFTLVRLNESDLNGAFKLDSSASIFEEFTISDEAARSRFGARSSDDLRLYDVTGDSMISTLNPGDVTVLDISVDTFTSDGIYLFTFGDNQNHLKRLQRVKDKIVVLSDNPAYERWEISAKEMPLLKIAGLMIGKWDVNYQRLG